MEAEAGARERLSGDLAELRTGGRAELRCGGAAGDLVDRGLEALGGRVQRDRRRRRGRHGGRVGGGRGGRGVGRLGRGGVGGRRRSDDVLAASEARVDVGLRAPGSAAGSGAEGGGQEQADEAGGALRDSHGVRVPFLKCLAGSR